MRGPYMDASRRSRSNLHCGAKVGCCLISGLVRQRPGYPGELAGPDVIREQAPHLESGLMKSLVCWRRCNSDQWSELHRVRRETGKEQRVQVPYSEGVANHAGPESCAVHREVFGEALTGVRAGQPLSRERISSPGADAVRFAEGYMVRPEKLARC